MMTRKLHESQSPAKKVSTKTWRTTINSLVAS